MPRCLNLRWFEQHFAPKLKMWEIQRNKQNSRPHWFKTLKMSATPWRYSLVLQLAWALITSCWLWLRVKEILNPSTLPEICRSTPVRSAVVFQGRRCLGFRQRKSTTLCRWSRVENQRSLSLIGSIPTTRNTGSCPDTVMNPDFIQHKSAVRGRKRRHLKPPTQKHKVRQEYPKHFQSIGIVFLKAKQN